MRKTLNILIIIGLVLMVIGIVGSRLDPSEPASTVVSVAPIVVCEPVKLLVDYYADWCQPCRMAKSKVDELEKSGVKVIRINADRSPELLRKNSVTLLPTFICTISGEDRHEILRTQNIDEAIKFFDLDLVK